MNLPNKLTTARVVLIPLFLLALYGEYWLAALVIFALASITDALDGHIARSRGLVTDFGKFMDPLSPPGWCSLSSPGNWPSPACGPLPQAKGSLWPPTSGAR